MSEKPPPGDLAAKNEGTCAGVQSQCKGAGVMCPASIKRAITRFDRAAQEFAFLGAIHPDDRDAVEEEYRRARFMLEDLIDRKLRSHE